MISSVNEISWIQTVNFVAKSEVLDNGLVLASERAIIETGNTNESSDSISKGGSDIELFILGDWPASLKDTSRDSDAERVSDYVNLISSSVIKHSLEEKSFSH